MTYLHDSEDRRVNKVTSVAVDINDTSTGLTRGILILHDRRR